MAKGSSYEREIAKLLSLWWTNDRRDDVFYRSQASGARGTVRHKRTAGAHGDITAADPCGEPLLDVFTFEIKRGYSTRTVGDLHDWMPGNKISCWEEWIYKAERDAVKAGSAGWALITRRNMRDACICMPYRIAQALTRVTNGGYRPGYTARVNIRWRERVKGEITHGAKHIVIAGGRLSSFLGSVRRRHIEHLSRTL